MTVSSLLYFDDLILRGKRQIILAGSISLPNHAKHGNIYAPQWLLSITFLTEATSTKEIWTIESCRRGNAETVAIMSIQALSPWRIPCFLASYYLNGSIHNGILFGT